VGEGMIGWYHEQPPQIIVKEENGPIIFMGISLYGTTQSYL